MWISLYLFFWGFSYLFSNYIFQQICRVFSDYFFKYSFKPFSFQISSEISNCPLLPYKSLRLCVFLFVFCFKFTMFSLVFILGKSYWSVFSSQVSCYCLSSPPSDWANCLILFCFILNFVLLYISVLYLALFYNFYLFPEIFPFSFVSREFEITSCDLFMMAALRILSDNPNNWLILGLASDHCPFLFKSQFSFFLVDERFSVVTFVLYLLFMIFWVLFKSSIFTENHFVMFSTYWGLEFPWRFNLQDVYSFILVCLVYPVLLGLPLASSGTMGRSRQDFPIRFPRYLSVGEGVRPVWIKKLFKAGSSCGCAYQAMLPGEGQ